MTIELYVFPPSPRALKVLAVANHLGIDYAQRMIDLTKGDQKAPEYTCSIPTCACRPSKRAIMCCGNQVRSSNIWR